jgi:hypothetical protein
VLDILPAALASVIGGFLFSHYQLGRVILPAQVAEQHTAASAEMMKLVRDEHALIVDFLNAEMAAEKSRIATSERPTSPSDIETRPATAAAAPRHAAVVTAAAKPVTSREPVMVGWAPREVPATTTVLYAPPPIAPYTPPASAVAAHEPAASDVMPPPRPPVAVAQAGPSVSAEPSLITRTINETIGIKDGVVNVSQHAAAVIVGIPSWIVSGADRAGAPNTTAAPTTHLVSANW